MKNSYPKSKHLSFLSSFKSARSISTFNQGRRERGAEGAVCPRASGYRGPHRLISKYISIAFLDVFKEPPNRSSPQGSNSAFKFSSLRCTCFLSLLLPSITDTRNPILQFCPWAWEGHRVQFVPGPRRPHQLISEFSVIDPLHVFKEPPNRSSQEDSKCASIFSSPDSLAFCPFCLVRSQTPEASLCKFAPGPRKPLGSPAFNRRSYCIKFRQW